MKSDAGLRIEVQFMVIDDLQLGPPISPSPGMGRKAVCRWFGAIGTSPRPESPHDRDSAATAVSRWMDASRRWMLRQGLPLRVGPVCAAPVGCSLAVVVPCVVVHSARSFAAVKAPVPGSHSHSACSPALAPLTLWMLSLYDGLLFRRSALAPWVSFRHACLLQRGRILRHGGFTM